MVPSNRVLLGSVQSDKGLASVKTILGLFEKSDGERSNCPKCDGSGLLHHQSFSLWNRQSSSSDPCWFCEGVGVMPLYGLRGFLLGRASTTFKTEDLNNPSLDPPIRAQLCLGKYPGTKCKLRYHKPADSMPELLYKFSERPSWLMDAADELTATRTTNILGHSCELGNIIVSNIRNRAVLKSPMTSTVDDSKASTQYGQTEAWNSFIQNKFQLIGSLTSGPKENQIVVGQDHRPRLKSDIRYTDESNGSLQIQVEESIRPLRWKNRHLKRTRLPRRNTIRVKAEREAAERALRMQRIKKSMPSDSPSNLLIKGADLEWSFSSSWKELSQSWVAEETALAQESAIALAAQSEIQEISNQPLINFLFYANLLENQTFIPKIEEPLGW